jgi:glucosamine--fructose-6-phosphate aminotransferase (isomerizing)
VIEHTNQVRFLEDDDVAVVRDDCLNIHRNKKGDVNEATHRDVHELRLELQQIMKRNYKYFMQKEIF